MTEKKELAVLSVRLGAINKQRWENYCARNGKTQSTAIREAIEKAMDAQEPPKPPTIYQQVETEYKKEKKVRFPILLTRSEKTAIEQRAKEANISQVSWVVDAIRIQLTREPQLNMNEILVLGESNYQLQGLGKNLNQIAKRINASNGGEGSDLRLETINDVVEAIKGHVIQVSKLIRATTERWDIK
jgi:hypothetical protein